MSGQAVPEPIAPGTAAGDANRTAGSALDDALENHPLLRRLAAWAGVATVVITNSAKVVEALGKLRPEYVRFSNAVGGWVYAKLGQTGTAILHYAWLTVAVSLLAIGYFALAYWVDQRYLKKRSTVARRVWRTLLVLLFLTIAGYSSASLLRPAKNIEATIESVAPSFGQELVVLNPRRSASGHLKDDPKVDARDEPGGIRYDRNDPAVTAQAWTTAQALVALLADRHEALKPEDAKLIRRHLDYLDSKRLPDLEGWGYMEPFDWGVTEIAAWVVLAELASIQPAVAESIWGKDLTVPLERIKRDVAIIRARQERSGGWSPIADVSNPKYARTYSTVMSIWALAELDQSQRAAQLIESNDSAQIRDGMRWLMRNYAKEQHSWVPNPERGSQNDAFPGLTVQTLFVLGRTGPNYTLMYKDSPAYKDALDWFVQEIDITSSPTLKPRLVSSSPAENARVHDSDRYLDGSRFMVESSSFLWMPWTLALCSEADTIQWGSIQKTQAVRQGCQAVKERVDALETFVRAETFTYAMAESLLGLRLTLPAQAGQK